MPNIMIIGATSGVGYALARLCEQSGWHVGATGRRLELLEQLRDTNPDRIYIRQHDVTKADSVAILDSLADEMGGVDVVVYSSGLGTYNPKFEWWLERDTIAVNVTGFTESAVWARHYFEKKGGGHFVGISSVAALFGHRVAPAYNATKAYVVNYLEAVRQSAWHHKLPLFVTDIRLGFVDTPMTRQNEGLMFWKATPEKAARQILHAIKRRKRVAYVTRRYAVAACFLKLLPPWIREKA